MPHLIDISHVSKNGYSLNITLPKSLWKMLDIDEEKCTIGFYEMDGKIIIQKMK
jgi:antitoxin component of MazEF toxin-antitoxin module